MQVFLLQGYSTAPTASQMGYTSSYDLARIKTLITWKFHEMLPLNYSSPLMELVVILSTVLIITICDNLGEEGIQLSVACSRSG